MICYVVLKCFSCHPVSLLPSGGHVFWRRHKPPDLWSRRPAAIAYFLFNTRCLCPCSCWVSLLSSRVSLVIPCLTCHPVSLLSSGGHAFWRRHKPPALRARGLDGLRPSWLLFLSTRLSLSMFLLGASPVIPCLS